MILISNSCLGAFTYQSMDLPFSSPFIWAQTCHEDILTVAKRFNTIDWYNIKISLKTNNLFKNFIVITVDNILSINFFHYRQVFTPKKQVISGINVIGNDVYKYATEAYFRRVGRMLEDSGTPLFLISSDDPIMPTYDTYANELAHISPSIFIQLSDDKQLNVPHVIYGNFGHSKDTIINIKNNLMSEIIDHVKQLQ